MSYERIPAELRALNQWILYDKDKIPYQTNGAKADVSNSNTWTNYDNCIANIQQYSGIGFVFSTSDKYCGIDLDYSTNPSILEAQLKIFNEFDSYSEISPSGKGLHIIVKGTVPDGARKDKIEVYSSNRYFTMTGNVYNDKPIMERQLLLTQLYKQLKTRTIQNENARFDTIEKYTDKQIMDMASNADNKEKFIRLYGGHWNDTYKSQSEADLALINIIAFYSDNEIQIKRIFRNSGLGIRPKAKREDYVGNMVKQSMDRKLPPIDFSGFKEALENKIAARSISDIRESGNSATNGTASNGEIYNGVRLERDQRDQSSGNLTSSQITIPPGLIGQIARFIYSAAYKPSPEIAIAAAFGLMAGICGRAYNVSSTGLNQYILLLAPTGTGKEAMSSGIDRLMASVKRSVIDAKEFIGPSAIASGQALVRYLDKTSKCFVSLIDEFDRSLKSMSNTKGNNAQIVLQQKLLEVYQKSGRGQEWQPSVYADAEKNTKVIPCPAFSILAYCTPEMLYAELDEDMIISGLLPRFSIIEYKGERPESNFNHAFVQPSAELTNQLADLCAQCLKMQHGIPQQWVDISFTEDAWISYQQFDKQCDKEVNKTNKEIYRRLWTRANLKVLKIAGLIAVGCNYIVPTITVEHLQYAIDMVTHDIKALTAKFESGETGKNTDEIRQDQELLRTAIEFFNRNWEEIQTYCPSSYSLYKMKLIPKQYFDNRTAKLAVFKNDKRGPVFALDRAIKKMIEHGKLIDYTRHPNYKLLATTKVIYAPTPDLLA